MMTSKHDYSMDRATERMNELFDALQIANKQVQAAITQTDVMMQTVTAAIQQNQTVTLSLDKQSDTLAGALGTMNGVLESMQVVAASQTEILHTLGNMLTIALGWRYLGAAQGLDIELERPDND